MYTDFNTPTHPGALSPAQLIRRAAERAAEAVAAVILTAGTVITILYTILTF